MSGKLALTIMGIGVLAMVVGMFVPSIIAAQDDQQRDAFMISVDNTKVVDESVRYTLDAVNSTNGTVNLTIRDETTLSKATITNLSVDETKNVSFHGEKISVTLIEVEDSETAILKTSFPWTYGWDDGAKTTVNNLDNILVTMGVVIMIGGLGAVLL